MRRQGETPSISYVVHLQNISYLCLMATRKKRVTEDLNNHKESLRAFSWCIRSDIRAYPVPSGGRYQIVVESGLETLISPQTYSKEEWSAKIWEIYRHYYAKNNKGV